MSPNKGTCWTRNDCPCDASFPPVLTRWTCWRKPTYASGCLGNQTPFHQCTPRPAVGRRTHARAHATCPTRPSHGGHCRRAWQFPSRAHRLEAQGLPWSGAPDVLYASARTPPPLDFLAAYALATLMVTLGHEAARRVSAAFSPESTFRPQRCFTATHSPI